MRKSQLTCEYCREKDPNEMFQCTEDNCNRWFCNSGRVKGAQGSHIIFHLLYTGHKSIAVHHENTSFPRDLSCGKCQNSRIFSLGYVEIYDEILCRVPCLNELELTTGDWKSLTKEKVLNFNFEDQDPEDFEFFNQVEENIIGENGVALKYLQDIERQYAEPLEFDEEELASSQSIRIKKCYPDVGDYIRTFSSLMIQDHFAEAKNHHKNKLVNVNFFFDNTRRKGFFYGLEYGCKFNYNDKIFIKAGDGWDAEGKLVSIKEGKYFIEVFPQAPLHVKKISMWINYSSKVTERLNSGLNGLGMGTVDPDIVEIILGKKNIALLSYSYNESDYSIPGWKNLNSTQNAAVRNALKYKVSIIQGPPGTGKTETITAICYSILLIKNNSEAELMKRKNLNRVIMENTRLVHKAAETAFEIAQAAALKCASAEGASKKALKFEINKRKRIETEISKEIQEAENSCQEKIAEFQNLNLVMLGLIPKNSQSRRQFLKSFNQKNREIHEKMEEIQLIKSKVKRLNLKKNASIEYRKSCSLRQDYKRSELKKPQIKEVIDPSNPLNFCYNPNSKILICASSNAAVALLSSKISKLNTKIIHIYARYKEQENDEDPLSLHVQVREVLRTNVVYQQLKKHFDLCDKFGKDFKKEKKVAESEDSESADSEFESLQELENLNQSDEKLLEISNLIGKENLKAEEKEALSKMLKGKLFEIKKQAEKNLLKDCEVICCTCITSGLKILEDIHFQHVIVDEATQSLEPETIQCFLKDASHIVLVGDIMQLGAVVKSREASNNGLDISLIERLTHNRVPHQFLSVQYRMHPIISNFSNNFFYEGRIQSGVSVTERTYQNFRFPDPIGDSPTIFYHIVSNEEISGDGKSLLNRHEADAIKKILFYMMENGVPGKHVGIITFYDGQKGYLQYYLENSQIRGYMKDVDILSVDASQGREKEFIILSCVRANDSTGVGFLEEFRRLNVAMTRAMYGLIVCGNALTLISNQIWGKLVKFYQDMGKIFTGDFENLDIFDIDTGPDIEFLLSKKIKYGD